MARDDTLRIMRARPRLHVTREGDSLVLHGAHRGRARVFAGLAPDRIDRERALAEWRGGEPLRLAGLPAAERHFLAVIDADGSEELVSERLLPLEGAQNFRDVGGYPTRDGRRVRWGRVFRSDSLAALSEADLRYLERIGLRLACDLRGDAEVEEAPSRLADHPPVVYWRQPLGDAAVQPSEWRRRFETGELDGIDASWLVRSYRGMMDRCAEEIGAVFRRLACEDGLPAVLHCTAGKDRTGLIAALLLLGLGVPRGLVLEDYALTGHYTGDRIRAAEQFFRERGVDPAQVSALMGSEPATLAEALDHLEATHGGVERWARERAGLADAELGSLREALLDEP